MGRIWIALGGVAGAGAVAMAAVAAHAASLRVDAHALAAVLSAVQMQGWHALALVLTGLWVMRAAGLAGKLANSAGFGFAAGTLMFSGSVYANHFGSIHFGPVTPVGGVLLMVSWLLLAASAMVAAPAR